MSEATDDGVAVTLSASTEWKVRVGFGFALTCLGAIGIVSYLSVVRLSENAARVEHTHEVLSSLELLLAAATDCETAERGYVITGDESYLEPYREAAAVIDSRTRRLREVTADNRAQQRRLDSVAALVTERLAVLRAVIELRRDQGFAAAQGEILTGKGRQFHDRIRRLIGQMEDTETSLLQEREQRANHSSILAQAVIIGGGLLACGLVGLALFAIRRDFAGRTRAERALRDARDRLELRVRQRTAELEKAGETKARLASIIESSDDAIASKNLDGIITSWNRGAERLFGYSAQEAVGQPMAMLIPPERASEEPTILAGIARGETTDHFETVRVGKDGHKIDVSVSISPLRDRKSTRLNSSHRCISYAVFCLKKKKAKAQYMHRLLTATKDQQ